MPCNNSYTCADGKVVADASYCTNNDDTPKDDGIKDDEPQDDRPDETKDCPDGSTISVNEKCPVQCWDQSYVASQEECSQIPVPEVGVAFSSRDYQNRDYLLPTLTYKDENGKYRTGLPADLLQKFGENPVVKVEYKYKAPYVLNGLADGYYDFAINKSGSGNGHISDASYIDVSNHVGDYEILIKVSVNGVQIPFVGSSGVNMFGGGGEPGVRIKATFANDAQTWENWTGNK